MNADEWIKSHFDGEFFVGHFDELKKIAHKLELNPTKAKVITIGGTNGKGQTARMLAQSFKYHKKKYFLWTSPHLIRVNERFVFNGEDLSDQKLLEVFNYLKENTLEYKLSYFEFLYLCCLKLVKDLSPDYFIQEVGLGGRLDATNILDADIACVTSISRDHQLLLGKRFEQILFEKLGIARKNKVLISAFELNYLRSKTAKKMSDLNVAWFDLFELGEINVKTNFSKRNLAMAKFLFKSFYPELDFYSVGDNFQASRAELSLGGAKIKLFPTHNLDGVRKLVQFLPQEQYNKLDLILFAPSRRDLSDLRAISIALKRYFLAKTIKLVRFEHIKALGHLDLETLAKEFNFEIIDTDLLFNIKESETEILALGSNYFIGDLLIKFQSSSIKRATT